jgi:hypothetical protein
MHLSQQKFFDLLGTYICMPRLYIHCNLGLELRPICNVGLEPRPIFFRYPIFLFHIHLSHYPLRAGGLFHFKKNHVAYNIAAEDYEAMPLFVSSKEDRLLNEFFLNVLIDLHTTQGPEPQLPIIHQCRPCIRLHLSRRWSSVSILSS